MAKTSNIAVAARKFSDKWAGQGYERGQSQSFWLELLQSVYGIQDPFSFIDFEGQIKNRNSTSFMDAYIPSTRVLIEQKSIEKDLAKPVSQSDGSLLTPYEQAKKYVVDMPVSKHPRWVVTCNFREFRVYDMENPLGEPEVIELKNLDKEYYRLSFLVDDSAAHTKKEVEVSMAAGRIIGDIYDALLKEYRNPEDPNSLRSLNILCVRLVFCLYAEDAGLFSSHSQFHDYLIQFRAGTGEMRKGLLDLFEVLNTPLEKRDPYLRDDLAAFPYVNGGLFAEAGIEVPRFNERIATLLLRHASDDFDWSEISPTIFGGVFESTLNPETRRAGGMHYTSIENIHKVIDPLFLDDLKQELNEIKAIPIEKKRIQMAQAFQDKLASLKFLDPACGSGNFLTETFLSLRRLENEVIRIIYKGQMMIGEFVNPIKVSIDQFYGIEINDFAVSVAMTALWIAEAQMLFETEKIMQGNLDFLPLKTYTNIHEGNALRMDWNDVIPASELNYIMGNPPFLGYALQSKAQKDDLFFLSKEMGKNIDYVAGWYVKSARMMKDNRGIQAALVSTNSITQGEQTAVLWTELRSILPEISILFAHRTFRWDSEAHIKAHVHCVILGFATFSVARKRILFDGDSASIVTNINPYLVEGPDVMVTSRKRPVSDVPEIVKGSSPVDGGNLIIENEDYEEFIRKEPAVKPYIKRFVGAREFLHNIPRFCLWLPGVSPAELAPLTMVKERIRLTKEFRLASSKEATRKYADYPTRFMEIRQPDSDYIIIPRHSSESRQYIPMGYMDKDVICGDANILIPDASLYHLGVLESVVHMAWMRVVCGRIKSDYRYSNDVVYNNFPWPQPNDTQREKIEKTAQSILDARAAFPDSSLADLYDETLMPPELRRAHRANDAAVLEAYGFPKDATESDIVARLFKMYQELTNYQ